MTLADIAPCLEYPHMSARQIAIILLLGKERTMKLRDVARALNLNTPAVSRAWDTLSIMGFIKRERGVEDRRDVSGVLTDKGLEFAGRISG